MNKNEGGEERTRRTLESLVENEFFFFYLFLFIFLFIFIFFIDKLKMSLNIKEMDHQSMQDKT